MNKFRIDYADQRLWKDDQPVQINNKAFALLRLFIENQDRLLTKDQILDSIWGEVNVSEGLVREYVHDLRALLGDEPETGKARFIETVRGRGYRFLGGIAVSEGRKPVASSTTLGNIPPLLAVLPFRNLSSEPGQEYISEGITEDIIIGLSKVPHIPVIASHSTRAFGDTSIPDRELGKNLGVNFILQGTVRKAGDRIRVTAQLVDVSRNQNAWAEQYDRQYSDIVAVQDEIVGSIVHALGATDGVIERSVELTISSKPASTRAYDYYLQARKYFHQHGDTGFAQAQALFEKAIALDPNFGRAYSGLASLHFLRFKSFLTASFEDIERVTLDLALHAARLDPEDYLAHWVLGRLYTFQGKQTQGLAAFDRALQINPNDANVLAILSEHLIYANRAQAGLEACQRAIRLNPKCPDWYWWHLGFALFHLGRHQDALDSLQKMTSIGQAGRLLSAVYVHLGRLGEARAAARRFIADNPGFSIREWSRKEPYSDRRELERYTSALKRAGFPE